MHETQDSQNSGSSISDEPSAARKLKTIDLGIEGLAPAVHLGAGGSANVFAAKKIDTGEAVAVKLLRASADSDKERIRFEREQETIQRLVTHDGIVPVLDAGLTDREEPYFLMPLMEGSLQDRIDSDGALDWQTATQLVAQVADAVAFAHTEQVLHRDIKPGNILLDGAGVPRVSDFGIAKLMDSSVSKSSKSLGTPSFMPPERFNGLEATEESDVYGLGATLAALLSGSAPFLTGENDTDVAVMMRVVTEEPPNFEGMDVPEEVRLAVQRAMAKDPADRPETASEFAQQLRLAIDPHLDPAMTGPVTVAIPRRNLSIPDGPITDSRNSALGFAESAAGWTVDPTPADEEEERRKIPVLLFAAAAVILAGVLGFLGVNALSGDNPDEVTETATADELSSGVADELDQGSAETGQGDEADGSDDAAGARADDTPGESNAGGGGDDGNDITATPISGDDDADGSTGASNDTGSDDSEPDGDTADGSTGGVQDGGDDGGQTESEDEEITTEVLGEVEEKDPPPPPVDEPAAKPVACFSASKTSVETGQSVQFSNCSTDADSYSWDLDGSSSSSASTSYSWSTPGSKTVTLSVRGEGGTDTESIRITVSETPPPPPKPSACFNASPTTVETGKSVTLSNCSSDATSYSWTFGDGSSSTQKSPTKSWSSTGSKTVRLSVNGEGGTDSISKTITVTAPPKKPSACFNASTSTVDVNKSVSFTNCSSDANKYWWTFSDGSSSSDRNPSKSWSTAGNKKVELTATGPGGSHTTSKWITVNAIAVDPKPEACFTPNKTTIDEGQSITFTNCSKNATSYSWNFGDGGTSTQYEPTHKFNTVGSFTVSLTAKGAGGDHTATRRITVEAPVVTTPDERVRPERIRCTTHAANDWSWTWTTLPSWVNDYIVEFEGGGQASVGKQPASYRTTKRVAAIIAVDKNNHKLRTAVDTDDRCPAPPVGVDVPTGVSCSFSNFRWEGEVWTWQENWSWSAVSGISYRVIIETNGAAAESGVGGSSVVTNPSNGVPKSGKSVKSIIAVNSDGNTAVRNVNPCGNEGGGGWQAPPPK